jgi:hypothetical protein
LIAINIIALPGALADYLRRIGPNVTYMMATHPYIWTRHVTCRAFWSTLLGRTAHGQNGNLSLGLAIGCTVAIGLFLLLTIWRNRSTQSRDRTIAAVIVTAPLLMPYYLDYDFLLLAVPAVLLAREMIARSASIVAVDRWLIALWISLYLLLLFNPSFTQATGFNLCVPVLAAIAIISIVRISSPATVSMPAAELEDRVLFEIKTKYRALAS